MRRIIGLAGCCAEEDGQDCVYLMGPFKKGGTMVVRHGRRNIPDGHLRLDPALGTPGRPMPMWLEGTIASQSGQTPRSWRRPCQR